MWTLTRCVVLLLLLGCTCPTNGFHGTKFSHSLTFLLEGYNNRCFSVDTRQMDDRVYITFKTVEGTWDFDVWVRDSTHRALYSARPDDHDGEKHIFFHARSVGPHTICFDNSLHSRDMKLVAVSIGHLIE